MDSKTLKWRVSADAVDLLGRGLITDRVTAVFELVKNSYDANASNVRIDFIENGAGDIIELRLEDDGHGMSEKDITDKWLVIGTNSKRRSKKKRSEPPFNRRYVGEKGVGRFACDKLGDRLIIETQTKASRNLQVDINWGYYRTQADLRLTQIQSGNDVEQVMLEDLSVALSTKSQSRRNGVGTTLQICELRDEWDEESVLRLRNQLSRIVPIVAANTAIGFSILLNAPTFSIIDQRIKPVSLKDYATVYHKCSITKTGDSLQNELEFRDERNDFVCREISIQSFGKIAFEFMYFDVEALKTIKKDVRLGPDYIEGIKVYRDNIICTPFAEYESGLDRRRDIIGIDKRRYAAAFDKLSTRQFVGNIFITKERNPKITDATNRQDFVDNSEYRDFKQFIIDQVDELAKYKKAAAAQRKTLIQNNLREARTDVKEIGKVLKQITKDYPESKVYLEQVIEKTKEVTKKVDAGAKDAIQREKDFKRKEALYLSLLTLQDFANELAHGIRFAITPAIQAAEYLKDYIDDPTRAIRCASYAVLVYSQLHKVSDLVDFMLSSAQTNMEPVQFSLDALLRSIFEGAYALEFDRKGIEIQLVIPKDVELTAIPKYIEDVITNLVSNAIKYISEAEKRIIRCEVIVSENDIIIWFSDSGPGIASSVSRNLFNLFVTTTAEKGGSGLGLFIAKSRLEAMNGSIVVDRSAISLSGASFKISIPLK